MINRTKGILNEGARMENASWRRWFQKKNNIKLLPQDDLQPLDAGGVGASGFKHLESPSTMDSTGSAASPDIHGLLRSAAKKNPFVTPSTSAEGSGGSTDDPNGAQTTTGDANSSAAAQMWFRRFSFEDPRSKRLRTCLKKRTSSASSSSPKRVSFNENLNKTTYVRYR